VQRWKSAADVFDVAFEVLHVDGVEADDGRIEANVGLGDVGTEVVRTGLGRKVSIRPVERAEKGR